MSKPKKKQSPRDPLRPGRDTLLAGDYPAARRLLDQVAEDPTLSEADRAEARRLSSSTRLDALSLKVGLACFALFGIVVALVIFKQP